jgi:murein DD-endopeptidase MepM/ murein hydrolase activator NlpD
MKRKTLFILLLIVICFVFGIYFLYQEYFSENARTRRVIQFLRNPESQQAYIQSALTRCGDAPFILPTSGLIGFLWDDSFRPGHHHQGIDIFAGTSAGETPVYAAYAGYLTRLSDWKSSLIIRIPSDPLHPERQIWTYYTHLADPSGRSLIAEAFPPGTTEVYVSEGTLLGYQGNYSGTPGNPTGVHLHFSIVKDDGQGKFLNELDIINTLDPSPYFGMALNANQNKEGIPVCTKP